MTTTQERLNYLKNTSTYVPQKLLDTVANLEQAKADCINSKMSDIELKNRIDNIDANILYRKCRESGMGNLSAEKFLTHILRTTEYETRSLDIRVYMKPSISTR